MSEVIRLSLRNTHEEATAFIATTDAHEPPAQQEPPQAAADRIKTLNSALRRLNLSHTASSRMLSALKKDYAEWLELRRRMTGPERIADDREINNFLQQIPFVQTQRRLQNYVDNLELNRLEIEEELRTLPVNQAGGGAAAPPPPPPGAPAPHPPALPLHLPKITIPPFSGKIEEFSSFWSQFKVIHDLDNGILAPAIKLTYLKNYLVGDALHAVEGLPTTDNSYASAVEILKTQFGQPEAVKRSLYASFKRIPKLDGSAGRQLGQNLRILVDEIEKICLQLRTQGEDLDSLHIQLEIESKLPPLILKEIYSERTRVLTAREQWTTDKLRDKLREILQREEDINRLLDQSRISAPKSHTAPPRRFSSPTRRGKPPDSTKNPQTLTFATTKSKTTPIPKLPCVFCDDAKHFSSNCNKFSTRESRIENLKKQKRCFRCFDKSHMANQCQSKKECPICAGNHPKALCPNSRPHTTNLAYTETEEFAQSAQGEEHEILEDTAVNLSAASENSDCASKFDAQIFHSAHVGKRPALLMSVKAIVFNAEKPQFSRNVLIFLDTCSTSTYITTKLATDLKLPTLAHENIRFGVFNQPYALNAQSFLVPLSLRLIDGTFMEIRANSVDFIGHASPHIQLHPAELDPVRKGSLKPNIQWEIPDLLIGCDYYFALSPFVERQLESGLYLLHSKLGPLAAGPINYAHLRNHFSSFVAVNCLTSEPINERLIDEFLTLEGMGIRDSPSENDEKVWANFKENIKFEKLSDSHGRYEIALPWKNPSPTIASNFPLCKGRLKTILRSLKANYPDNVFEKYSTNFREQLEQGIIEEVENLEDSHTPLHFLPHLPVLRADKPSKIRIVFDASAKTPTKGCSLNDLLFQGPLLLADLVGVLARFRLPKIVITCDIEKAFLTISIRESDRDALRFLWIRNPDAPLDDANLIIYRFRRLPFGLTCSPFLLSATVKHHLERIGTRLAKEIDENVYVDNILLLADDPLEAQAKALETKMIFSECSMNIREFASNDASALELIPIADRETKIMHKILGTRWNSEEDELIFSLPPTVIIHLTKREILSRIACVFDPMGLISPILLPAKLVFQETWGEENPKEWDEEVSEAIKVKWGAAVRSWGLIDIKIPRRLFTGTPQYYELHAFADASSHAFATCIYLRTIFENDYQSALVYSKSKVKPRSQKLTIPRLELLAATLAVKALKFMKAQLHLKDNLKLFLWVDSTSVFHWIKNPIAQEIFVQNRLNTIRLLDNLSIGYVNTHDNPADLPSRGLDAGELVDSQLWWRGPRWLSHPSEDWPRRDDLPTYNLLTMQVHAVHANPAPTEESALIDVKRFSRWPKLLRVLAYVFRFVRKYFSAHAASKSNSPPPPISNILNLRELAFAQNFLLKEAQSKFPPADKENAKLQLYVDPHGLLRSKGRIYKSSLAFDAKEPIYLPPHAHVARLIVYETHLHAIHSPPSITLSLLRQKFWLPKGRKCVAHIIREKCMTCRRFSAPHFRWPKFPQLPSSRVNPAYPFEFTGVDYFGPLNVKEGIKIWGALYTCMTIRAIHLEIVDSLSAEAFLDSFKRFIARRGTPRIVYSDNGTQFTLSAKTLEVKSRENWNEIFNSAEIISYFSSKAIAWIHIVEKAPWRGGCWERLVASVKYHLKRCLGRSLLSIGKLNTLLTEIEAVVNSRPITYLSDDPQNPLPLRPLDFLHTYSAETGCPPFLEEEDAYIPKLTNSDKLLEIWRKSNVKLDSFWVAWRTDYLLSLRERNKTVGERNEIPRAPHVNELVLVEDSDLPRGAWRMATVEEVIFGEGVARTAVIRFSNGRTTRRAINHLYTLECTERESVISANA